MTKICIKSPDGEEIELLATDDDRVIEGAKMGAQSLLNLLSDEIDLEEGYEIIEKIRDDKPFLDD